MNELRFDGRVAIVTGGGRGFGRCHALLLAARGARVVVADYGVNADGSGSSPEPAEQVAKEIVNAGGDAVPCFASVADEAGAAAIVQTALDSFGGLDILVNNAGIVDPYWFEDLTTEQFRLMQEIHYLGTVQVSKAAWPHLQAAAAGCIVNTASEAILGNVPKSTSYAGAKGGVFAFTRALALDGMRHGIRVNAVSPRGRTRMSEPPFLAEIYGRPEETFGGMLVQSMRPEYVSPGVAYLAHDSCSLTGETLVCGGSRVMRLAVIQTDGIVRETITPEDIAGNIDEILDTTGAEVIGLEPPKR